VCPMHYIYLMCIRLERWMKRSMRRVFSAGTMSVPAVAIVLVTRNRIMLYAILLQR